MARRSTPERIDAARRAANRNRLISEHMTEETADAWLEAWEVKAAEDGLERGAAYWDSGWSWIAEQRQHRVRPRSGSAAAEEARLLNPQIGSRASVSAHS